MPKICYITKKFGSERMAKIDKANEIITEYERQGFELTLRQLFYQFVSRDLIANTQKEYKNLGDILNDARLAGLVDWNAIVDRTRNLRSLATWENPQSILNAVAQQFRNDKWASQPHRLEVWIEKDALVGVIENVCNDLQVPYFSCRGYTSQSELWSAARRLRRYHLDNGQTPVILHLGDHDPSGIDMTRDITDRLALFAGFEIEVKRLALNFDQIEQYNPPPNPCKLTDSRADGYMERHGAESWELDALEPSVIAGLIRDAVHEHRDLDAWKKAVKREDQDRKKLGLVSKRWEKITKGLR